MEERITAFANDTMAAAFANGTVIDSPVKGASCSVVSAIGTRRSTRHLGKERTYYGNKREPSEEMEELPKKRRICRGKQVTKTSLIPSKSNVALDTLESYGSGELVEEVVVSSKKSMICSHDSLELNMGFNSVDFKNGSTVNGIEMNAKVCLLSDQWKDENGISVEPELNMNDDDDKCGESGQASHGANKSAHMRVKETLRAFNTNYLQFVQVYYSSSTLQMTIFC